MSNQLFFLSLADIFSVYPQIFRELIVTGNGKVDAAAAAPIYLPSDWSWKERIYARLLTIQKRINEAIEGGMTFEDVTKRKDTPVFELRSIAASVNSEQLEQTARRVCARLQEERRTSDGTDKAKKTAQLSVSWSLENISKAAKLLKKPPLSVSFESELEMRRVYSLIYDVFRSLSSCTLPDKVVLSNVLTDVSFFKRFTQFTKDENRIWLMLYELFDRGFQGRPSELIELQHSLYRDAEVYDIAKCLWNLRVRLAGSVSRMRISYRAYNLAQLLPIHLQNEKVALAAANSVVTGWINPFLLRDRGAADKLLAQMGFELLGNGGDGNTHLGVNQYKWDTVCPLFISCVPTDRSEFSRSPLMTKHFFIMQDKTFSFGPAIMSKLLDHFELDGDILQTHISSPRSTAYLAALFHSVNRVNNFYVYGAGVNLREYRCYMETLGISNLRLFQESFTSFPLESNRFATVVGVFANPPNSYSAIADPIDLICSRGGDLSMLEVLTESEISDDGKLRVALILEEQYHTLRMCMSRSHTQFVLYQTHSIVRVENEDMVQHIIQSINAKSLEKHKVAFREKKRLQALIEHEAACLPAAALGASTTPRRPPGRDQAGDGEAAQDGDEGQGRKEEETEDNLKLPDIDEFMLETVPDICINQDNCLSQRNIGSFFSLIRRKGITRHNAKYLIKMAECRGLFGKGKDDKAPAKPKQVVKTQTMKEARTQTAAEQNRSQSKLSRQQEAENLLKRLQRSTFCSTVQTGLHRISLVRQKPYDSVLQMRRCKRCNVSKSNLWDRSSHIRFRWRIACRCAVPTKSARIYPKLGRTLINTRRRHFPRRGLPLHINLIKLRI